MMIEKVCLLVNHVQQDIFVQEEHQNQKYARQLIIVPPYLQQEYFVQMAHITQKML